jgi:cytochrome c oxidase subunit 2
MVCVGESPIVTCEDARTVRKLARSAGEVRTAGSQRMIRHALQALLVAAPMFRSVLVRAQPITNFQSPKSQIAHLIYDLHSFVQAICAGICVLLFALLFYAIVRFRKSPRRTPLQFTGYKPLEIAWVIIPVLILVVIAVPATRAVFAMKDTSNSDITVKITGYQWQWRYDYLHEDIGFYSALSTPRAQIENRQPKGENYLLEVDHPLVVPVGRKIRILVTANDVIHSWFVPAFGVKQDAIPGFIRDAWFRVDEPGVYRGQCAELCGKEHGFMPIVVKAVSEQEYSAWLEEQRAAKHAAVQADVAANETLYTLEDLKAGGQKVYSRTCIACHQANGEGLPPAFPALANGKTATGVRSGVISIVMNGSSKNPAMAAWKNQLSDLELASVITYVRNSFGNSVGDVVQPKDIAAARHEGK